MRKAKHWTIHEARAFDHDTSGSAAKFYTSQCRREYKTPGVEIRTFKRSVRAGGAVIPLTVVVVRSEQRVAPVIGTARA